jgi:glycosyltransferase involved in cell wall biosynthesis
MILGAGQNPGKTRQRMAELKSLATELGVEQDICLPGFVANPYPLMTGAAVFALSSRYEGLPTVLIEAMACGCPVVSTSVPGACEILDSGRYGRLVPSGSVEAMAVALEESLEAPRCATQLRRRAMEFSENRAVENYEKLLGLPE